MYIKHVIYFKPVENNNSFYHVHSEIKTCRGSFMLVGKMCIFGLVALVAQTRKPTCSSPLLQLHCPM
jgi:hypothetical protein